jgi:hypothetical protein
MNDRACLIPETFISYNGSSEKRAESLEQEIKHVFPRVATKNNRVIMFASPEETVRIDERIERVGRCVSFMFDVIGITSPRLTPISSFMIGEDKRLLHKINVTFRNQVGMSLTTSVSNYYSDIHLTKTDRLTLLQ